MPLPVSSSVWLVLAPSVIAVARVVVEPVQHVLAGREAAGDLAEAAGDGGPSGLASLTVAAASITVAAAFSV